MNGHSRKEQWCAIKFCVKLGKSGSETFDLLQNAYSENSLKKPTVIDWHKRFLELRNSQGDFSGASNTRQHPGVPLLEDPKDPNTPNPKKTLMTREERTKSMQELAETILVTHGKEVISVTPRQEKEEEVFSEESIYSNPIRSNNGNETEPNQNKIGMSTSSSVGYQLTSTYNRPRGLTGAGGGGSLSRGQSGIARKENCCDKFLTCLSHIPCASLIAWIILLLGLGGLTGSLLYGVTKCRKIMEDGTFWWFMEFTVIGVVVIMFVLGTLFLVIAHLSSDPTNRYVFNTSKKNMCARGLNIFVLMVAYFLAVIWVAGSSLAVMPLLVSTFILSTDFKKGDCIDLKYYGLDKKVCDPELEVFLKEGKELFTCYIFTYVSSVLVTISMIHFLISISANYTHLKDSRFATYNAYDTEEVRNSKHSILDTNM